jgi:large subunit ribosomal protein L4
VAKLKKYNFQGKQTGEVEVGDDLAQAQAHGQSVKDYLVAIRNNARQWSACTKDRGEVNHSNQKPHRQKGTGRARQGTLAAPHMRGGGRVHTPRPKFDQHVRINRKERRLAIRALLGDKIRAQTLHIIDDMEMTAPSTRKAAQLLKALGVEGRALILVEGVFLESTGSESLRVSLPAERHENLSKSLRNLPKVEFRLAANVSGYDLALARHVIVTQSALAELEEQLKVERAA